MIGQPQSHRRRPVLIAAHPIHTRQPQSQMGSMEVVIEQRPRPRAHRRWHHVWQRRAGCRVRALSRSRKVPLSSFDMHGANWLHRRPQRGAGLHRQQSSVLIAMLARLRQGARLGDAPRRTPPFAGQLALAIGPLEDVLIVLPPRASPVQLALVGPLDRGRHSLLDQVLAQRTGGPGGNVATVPILHQTSPAVSLGRLAICPLFFCTYDQISSISTWLRRRSLASACVMASA